MVAALLHGRRRARRGGIFATASGLGDAASCVLGGGTVGAEAVRTGAARFGVAAISVLVPRRAAGSADDWVCACEPLNRLPNSPAIRVGCGCGASPFVGCGGGCDIGTLAITTGWLDFCDACVVAGGLGLRGNAPGTVVLPATR